MICNKWKYLEGKYGKLPLNQSRERTGVKSRLYPSHPSSRFLIGRQRVSIVSLTPLQEGQTILFRARVTASRAQGSKMVFFNLRQRTDSIQALVVITPEKVSKQMVKWATTIPVESIVLVQGTIQLPMEEVKSASIGNIEILISEVIYGSRPLEWCSDLTVIFSFMLWHLQKPVFHSLLKMHPVLKANSRKRIPNLPVLTLTPAWTIAFWICVYVLIILQSSLVFNRFVDANQPGHFQVAVCRHRAVLLIPPFKGVHRNSYSQITRLSHRIRSECLPCLLF